MIPSAMALLIALGGSPISPARTDPAFAGVTLGCASFSAKRVRELGGPRLPALVCVSAAAEYCGAALAQRGPRCWIWGAMDTSSACMYLEGCGWHVEQCI